MPWTFAHPAAVLPLRRVRGLRAWPFDALVVGSLVPDLGYYLGWPAAAALAHGLSGLALFDLPAGLALLASWRLLRAPIAALLPRRHRAVWLGSDMAPVSPRVEAWARDAAALGVGAATHLAWDAFTHARGWVVQQWPALQASLGHVGDRGFPVFNVLQHGSTVAGVVLLVLAYRRRLIAPQQRQQRQQQQQQQQQRGTTVDEAAHRAEDRRCVARLLALAAFSLAAAGAVTLASRVPEAGLSTWIARGVETVVHATDVFTLGLVAAALWNAGSRRRNGRGTGAG